MRRWRAAALASLATLVLATPAVALRITGTDGPDILRGTARADRLLGGKGNDKLYGLAGNDILAGGKGRDLLVGGPGNDRIYARDGERDKISCGPGRDKVIGDQFDKPSKDCEIVLRRHVEPPIPVYVPPADVPTPTVPPPTVPAEPPTTAVDAGSYKGATSVGNYVFFDVTVNRTIAKFRVNDFRLMCDGPLTLYGPLDVGSTYQAPIDASGNFSIQYGNDGTAPDGTPYSFTVNVTGYVHGSTAAGTAQLTEELDYQGRHWNCATEQQTWTANRLP
jgi:hypothetical protein